MPSNLKALDDFKKGEPGHATDHGASRLRSGFVPDAGIFVRALEDVRANQNGNFEELPQKSK
jgi:hypothetical protein